MSRFRLASVLRVRRHELDLAAARMAECERQLRRAEALCGAVRQRAQSSARAYLQQLRRGAGSPLLRFSAASLGHCAVEIEAAEQTRSAAASAVAHHRRLLLEARRRVRSLEQLEALHKERERRVREEAEQRLLDESALRRFARRLAVVVLLATLAVPSAPWAEEEPVPEMASDYGVTNLLTEIRAREAELDRRERELDDREHSLQALEAEATRQLAEIERIASTVEERIAAWEADNGDSVRKLAKIYAAMPPTRAAQLLEELEVELATQIVARMKDKKSAAVLAQISERRALSMSRRVAHPLGMEPARVPRRQEP